MEMSKSEKGGKTPAYCAPLQEIPVRDVPAIVGNNLRRLRKARAYSLERLAELSGVSRAMLGQIETGKSVPTVSLLWKVADALDVPVATLIATDNGSTTVVLPKSNSGGLAAHSGAFTRRPLFPLDRFMGTEFFELRIGPRHREIAEAHQAGTRENLVVVQGQLRITMGAEPAVSIGSGDAILFEADVAHAYENPGDIEVLAYLVIMHCARPAS